MSQIADPAAMTPPVAGRKNRLLPVVMALFLLLLGGGGGFAAMRLPQLFSLADQGGDPHAAGPGVAYVPLDPVVVNLPRSSGRQSLRFTASLEVAPAHQAEVTLIRPRIVDVMNTYLRAVDPSDFEQQAILLQLRAQLLRRVQVVAGEGRVRDLLVMEFILN